MSFESKKRMLQEILNDEGKESGTEEISFYCPNCKYETRKLWVNIEKNKFHCWVCGYGGKTLFHLVRDHGTISQMKAWEHFDFNQMAQTEWDDLRRKILTPRKDFSLKEFRSEFKLQLPSEYQHILYCKKKKPVKYLVNRGLDMYDILKWQAGVCLSGKYKERILIPSFDVYGKLNYFVSRTYGHSTLRYLNPPKEEIPKHKIIFNEFWLDWNKDIILVEGVFDALKFRLPNVVPILGTALSDDSLLLQRLLIEKPPRVLVAYDLDARKKQEWTVKQLLKKGLQAVSVEERLKEDWGAMHHEEISRIFLKYDNKVSKDIDFLKSAIERL